MTHYLLKIPAYRYNTGRADNGNTLFVTQYSAKEEAIANRDFVNAYYDCTQDEEEHSEEVNSRYQDHFNGEGYQIGEAFVTQVTEIRIC